MKNCSNCMHKRTLKDGRMGCFIRSILHVFVTEPDNKCTFYVEEEVV